MKKLLLIFSILFLSVTTFAGDGAEGGGAQESLLKLLLNDNNSIHNPMYAKDDDCLDTEIVYEDSEIFYQLKILDVKLFHFEDGTTINIEDVRMFITSTTSKHIELMDMPLTDVLGIVVGDRILLANDISAIEITEHNRRE